MKCCLRQRRGNSGLQATLKVRMLVRVLRELSSEFCEWVGALKHDLGKSVAWRSANLPEELWIGPVKDELVEALRMDILYSRVSSDGTRCSIFDIWQASVADMNISQVPELCEVERAIEELRSCSEILDQRDLKALEKKRQAIRMAQRTIRQALRHLHRRTLQQRSAY